MGNIASKKSEDHEESLGSQSPQIPTIQTPGKDGENDNNGDTPLILKNRHHIMALVDPRSPTQEISRTPIALEDEKTGKDQKLNPRLAKLKENLTPLNGSSTSGGVGFFDPRSPSQEIDRTPIRYSKRDGVATTKIAF